MNAIPQRAAWQDRANPTRAALEEALRLNMPAFPCRLPDKRPTCPHGFKDATAVPDELRQLWRNHPGQLVGVPTGDPSGLFVIDVDSTRHEEAQDWLERHSPYLPDTRHHATKSGGVHLLFKHQQGLKNTASRLAKGVDTRGEGGYIIWWPFHLGLGAGHYFGPIAALPDWIFEALQPPPPVTSCIRPDWSFRHSFSGAPEAKVQGVLNAVAAASIGERNHLLFWGACRITEMIVRRELGSMEGSRSFQALNMLGLKIGLTEREISRTIQSATVPR